MSARVVQGDPLYWSCGSRDWAAHFHVARPPDARPVSVFDPNGREAPAQTVGSG